MKLATVTILLLVITTTIPVFGQTPAAKSPLLSRRITFEEAVHGTEKEIEFPVSAGMAQFMSDKGQVPGQLATGNPPQDLHEVDETLCPVIVEVAPLESLLEGVTVTPEAATNPSPSPASCSTVTVKVWASPTWLVASGEILMRASTQVLVPSVVEPKPDVPLVARAIDTPPTVHVAEALTVPVPTVVLFTVRVQTPSLSVTPLSQVPPVMVAVAPKMLAIAGSTVSPGAGTQPLPSPRSLQTRTVKVSVPPTSDVSDGVMMIPALTQVFTEGPVPPGPGVLAVDRETVADPTTPLIVTDADALTVVLPVVGLFTMIVHWPDAFVVVVVHVPPVIVEVAPLESLFDGVTVAPLTNELRRKTGLTDPRISGLVITAIAEDSPFRESLAVDAVILEINRNAASH